MKKMITTMTVAAMTAASMTTIPASANVIEYENDPALMTYANEHGNTTDRFDFSFGDCVDTVLKARKVNEDNEFYREYLARCSNTELASDTVKRYYSSALRDKGLGMSIAQILAHNGVITPDRIQPDRETLIDITHDNDTTKLLMTYQARQLATDFDLMTNHTFTHYDRDAAVDSLIAAAENADSSGKYFLILVNFENGTHAMTGMGIMNGSWNWLGEEYDTCIIVSDHNVMTSDTPGKWLPVGAAEPCCIYINSDTKKLFMPTYSDEMYFGDELRFMVIDDDAFLNHKGMCSPSQTYDTPIPDVTRVNIGTYRAHSLTVTGRDGSTFDGRADCGRENGAHGNNYYYCEGESFLVKNDGVSPYFKDFSVEFTDSRRTVLADFNGMVDTAYKNDTEFGFDTLDETAYSVTMAFEDGAYSFGPHYRFDLNGTAKVDFKAVQTDRGIVLSGKNGVRCAVRSSDVIRDENGLVTDGAANVQEDAVMTSGSVMVSFVNGRLAYFIGENYENEVRRGDVNCDGFIDASDASDVLAAYSAAATGGTSYVGTALGDMNGDGMVDASDASMILSKYAQLATK